METMMRQVMALAISPLGFLAAPSDSRDSSLVFLTPIVRPYRLST